MLAQVVRIAEVAGISVAPPFACHQKLGSGMRLQNAQFWPLKRRDDHDIRGERERETGRHWGELSCLLIMTSASRLGNGGLCRVLFYLACCLQDP